MSYSRSDIDKKNFNWFNNDNTRQSLVGIELKTGTMRGLSRFTLEIPYPITAISGKNGTGKSTLLAMASCAFHNTADGYKPPSRKLSYYTFSDFFIQAKGEFGPEGVTIAYKIRNDKWRNRDPGIAAQVRQKRTGGKWNDYAQRVRRNVAYLGIQRVVPYYERTTHRSYKARFSATTNPNETQQRIASLAGTIVGKKYESFESLGHSKYSLPKVKSDGITYSGFNMGAGESAVFDILTSVFAAGEGCLLVIDEIELGLHAGAQIRLVEELKKLCDERKCQIICTTHSYEVLSALPPEARVYLDKSNGNTQVVSGISAEYACGQMGGASGTELDILVEDEVAREVVQTSLPLELRERCQVLTIGSHSSLRRVMASRYMENRRNVFCLMDGDQRSQHEGTAGQISSYCDGAFTAQSEEIKTWAKLHISYLPGDQWPERWILQEAIKISSNSTSSGSFISHLSQTWGINSPEKLSQLLHDAIQSGKHKEFLTLAESLSLQEQVVRQNLTSALRQEIPAEFDAIGDRVRQLLA